MSISAHNIYLNMYYELDDAWKEKPNDALGDYLSEANPFFWKGCHSADPAIWAEYNDVFKKLRPDGCETLEDAYDFACTYLQEAGTYYNAVNPGTPSIASAFQMHTPLQAWEDNFSDFPTEGWTD